MKIWDILGEGMNWNGTSWVGGASDEGHDDFDPLQYHNRGFGPAPRRYDVPSRPRPRWLVAKMPYDAKDFFKDLVGKGNYKWDGDHKRWLVNANILTAKIEDQLRRLNVEIVK